MEIEPEQQRDINMNLLARVYKLEKELNGTQEHVLELLQNNAEIIKILIGKIEKLEGHAK